MAFVVWILYAGDRLMDTRTFAVAEPSIPGDFELRHHFHYRYRGLFVAAITLSIGALAVLMPSIPEPALRLYLIEGAFVAGYFGLVHGISGYRFERFGRLPKELLVGPFFAAASFIPTVVHTPEQLGGLLPNALLFAGLCSLNCLYIYAWEHSTTRRASWLTAVAVPRLQWLGTIFAALSFFLFFAFPFQMIDLRFAPLACGLSAIALITLHQFRHRFSSAILRAAADLALLSPLLIEPFLSAR